ncbi:MAG: VOC family protein [Kordiimonadaceae bacterium]|nr:VOC family protein [Kordiimonadaceae bacterium]
MIDFSRINHVGIRISNLAASRAFYERLGFEFLAGPIGPEPVAIIEHPSGVNINFILNANQGRKDNMLMRSKEKYTGYTHIALEVADEAKTIRQLRDLGIPLSGEPFTHPGGTSFFVRDPDDNVIEFTVPK